MSSALWVMLSIGALLIVKGIYDEKLAEARQKTRTVYRFLPRPGSGGDDTGDDGSRARWYPGLVDGPVDARSAGRPE